MLDGVPNEIVIVRRKNSWEDDQTPHGVWKIAYADFMTALMAFFLVMWLINVTDDSVRRGVAQYFNPVKLASTAPNRKGLNDPEINGETNEAGTKLFTGKLGGSDAPVDQDENFGDGLDEGHKLEEVIETPEMGGAPASGQFTQTHSESILFTDPYAVLDTLSQKIRVADVREDNPKGIGTGLQKNEGVQGGQAYRDPFDPMFWQFRPGRGVASAEAAPDVSLPGDGTAPSSHAMAGDFAYAAPFDEGTQSETGIAQQNGNAAPGKGAKKGDYMAEKAGTTSFEFVGTGTLPDNGETTDPVVAHVLGKSLEQSSGEVVFESETETVVGTGAGEGEGTYEEDFTESSAEVLVARLSEVLAQTEGTVLEETASQITVTREGEGALISLTDDQNFGMFAIGSAEPRPELVKLLERIGKIVADTPGQIVIKGHTDARPFRSKTYDNWRLSSARAHMALYMLSRGGVGKDRFNRVEGYADKDLKVPSDPFAASNRRIEIYLLEGAR
ncbi:flagellar motor protein MotB [Stappia aggregata IAM 12614]|uniref:Flagellar motor protein MotB n=1 Tax=Roseibium aggregatum (strain ATCC 25650 / DSM 13394 / JCM 20685 / NBRC 16684 / NCIMB 2208 / IAM 12614 / B1) TaxID=384765 RepID=A0NT23_ROSAI|nr:MotB family protein [Roseibium aggregatum]EAV44105.1 flagellar motor protein MotB [Stappia aggregata IAM 12614] [Roseibium aggregatum IAM 12614]